MKNAVIGLALAIVAQSALAQSDSFVNFGNTGSTPVTVDGLPPELRAVISAEGPARRQAAGSVHFSTQAWNFVPAERTD